MHRRIAIYPGSFDPLTNGHLDLIERGSSIFEHLIVAVLRNAEKDPLFTVSERCEMIQEMTARYKNVSVESFEGLLVEGGLQVSGGLHLEVRHSTLVPGQGVNEQGEPAFPDRPSLSASGTKLARMRVILDHAICGPVILPAGIEQVEALDSILHAPQSGGGTTQAALAGSLDGVQPGPPASLQRVTVFGLVHVREIDLASEVIFNDAVKAERRQVGCVRFSYLPDQASQVPAPYRCQPALALEQRAVELMLPAPSIWASKLVETNVEVSSSAITAGPDR